MLELCKPFFSSHLSAQKLGLISNDYPSSPSCRLDLHNETCLAQGMIGEREERREERRRDGGWREGGEEGRNGGRRGEEGGREEGGGEREEGLREGGGSQPFLFSFNVSTNEGV